MQLLEDWLQHLQHVRGYSEHTILAYQNDGAHFLHFLQQHHGEVATLRILRELSTSDGRSWLAARHREGYSKSATSRALSSIRHFYRWLEREHGIENSAIFYLRSPKLNKPLPKALQPDQALAMVGAIGSLHEEAWLAARDEALLMLVYGCGLRISEALGLTVAGFSAQSGSLRILGKGNKQRDVPLLPIVSQKITDYVRLCPWHADSDSARPLFYGLRGAPLDGRQFRKNLQNIRRALSLPETATPHAFRHSFATHLLAEGADL
ncbi:MAG: recombinase XerC, partial [Rickettsiales bacterium]|nr:recombinase XerC [Rickettsiales bacterium]